MTKEHLETLVKMAYDQAKRVIIEHKKPLMPTWLIVDDKGRAFVMGTPWKDDLDKMMIEVMLRYEFKERKTVAYSVVTEAWMSRCKMSEKGPFPRPSKDPDRIEVVIACATDGKTKVLRSWEIKRNHLELAVKLEELPEVHEEVQAESWMLTLLEEEKK